ncbi:MAG: energy-coupling factor ABC transporter ATP-binding protein [Candidatus Hydrothermarchaeota archaeon]
MIRVNNISYRYPDGTQALKNVSIYAEKGECIAILGPNGSGKTTLLHHLNGLLSPISGEIYINGERIEGKNLDKIRRKVGLLFQNPDDQLFAPTVREDVAFGPKNLELERDEIKKRVEKSLRLVHIEHLGNKPINSLSYGEKKRVAIAGVLAMNPDILVFDEPISALDPVMSSEMIELILKLKKELKVTLVIATHDVDFVPLCADRIYVLNKGEIVAEGTPKEVFRNKEVITHCGLRLPIISQLFESINSGEIPLTIEEAKNLLRDMKWKA